MFYCIVLGNLSKNLKYSIAILNHALYVESVKFASSFSFVWSFCIAFRLLYQLLINRLITETCVVSGYSYKILLRRVT